MVVMMGTWTGSEKEIEKENGKETETETEIEIGKTETENVTEKETGIATEKENEKDMLMVSAHLKVMLLLSGRTGLNLNRILILFSSHVFLGTKNNSKRKRDDKDSGVRTCCVLNCMVFK